MARHLRDSRNRNAVSREDTWRRWPRREDDAILRDIRNNQWQTSWDTFPTLKKLSTEVSKSILTMARFYTSNIPLSPFSCSTCFRMPFHDPINGECGHLRCLRCAIQRVRCPCGGTAPKRGRYRDIKVQEIFEICFPDMFSESEDEDEEFYNSIEEVNVMERALNHVTTCATNTDRIFYIKNNLYRFIKRRPTCAKARFVLGRVLLMTRKPITAVKQFLLAEFFGYRSAEMFKYVKMAIPHYLLHIKMSNGMNKKYRGRLSLSNTTCPDEHILYNTKVKEYLKRKIINRITHEFREAVIFENQVYEETDGWFLHPYVKAEHLECCVCTNVFVNPVTTPCGHTFCKDCLERMYDHSSHCPVCKAFLEPYPDSYRVNAFISAVLKTLPAEARTRESRFPNMLPIFVCTVVFPNISCPLFVFETRYRLMLRRCLESGTRRIGMVAAIPGQNGERYADYGTVLEIKDCVKFEDGCSLISTVGVSRFKVMERAEIDGYDVAKIKTFHDQVYGNDQIYRLLVLVRYRAELWLSSVRPEAREEIQSTFGMMPPFQDNHMVMDGPSWVWWILEILPLGVRLKLMILMTDDLMKRLGAIYRTIVYLEMAENPNEVQVEKALECSINSTELQEMWMKG